MNKPRPPRAVLFDAVGTLIRPEPAVARAYQAAGARFGAVHSEATIAERFRAAIAEFGRSPNLRTNSALERQRWRNIVSTVFREVPRAHEELLDSLWEHFAQPQHWRLEPAALETWNGLEQAGLTVGIASNFDERLPVIVRNLLGEHVRHVFYSAGLGFQKPSVEFFRAIEQELTLPAGEILLVGDDPVNDFQGAQQAGWQAVLLESSSAPPANHSIRSLADLPHWLNLQTSRP